MSTPKSDLLQGTLDMLILQVVAPGSLHGYAIAQRLQQVSKDILQVQQGSLYPALHRLECRGWIKAEWGASDNNRRAKYYALTKKGHAELEAQTTAWRRLTQAVGQVLDVG